MNAQGSSASGLSQLTELASLLRRHSVQMTHIGRASHLGSSLSMVELLVVLYWRILRIDPDRPQTLKSAPAAGGGQPGA